ncbi:MAG: twin-arginine translocase subunit TatC [Gammaproteobacteria bacterium]|nr:twin-arginine translocase subunit TatC [Gammaproteobacteria bacterium]
MTNTQTGGPPDDREQSILSHLLELRNRLLKAVICIGVVFVIMSPFSNDIFSYLAQPLMRHLETSSMIATGVAAPFIAPFKLTLFLALLFSVPYVFYQVWAFVAPGLYLHERRLVYPLMVSSTVLFYLGVAFAYYVVFDVIFAFFTASAPDGITVMTDMSAYLDFILTLFLAFGITFEVPIATVLLIKTGIVELPTLVSARPYIIVGSFVLGMLLTPPDVVSQTLLAIPIWILFEAGLLVARMVTPKDDAESTPAS